MLAKRVEVILCTWRGKRKKHMYKHRSSEFKLRSFQNIKTKLVYLPSIAFEPLGLRTHLVLDFPSANIAMVFDSCWLINVPGR